MDGLKEIFAAFEARVKSKVIGSVILAFIATNWKAIFYVIFEKTNSVAKFQYFDANTTIWTLLFIPLGIGIFLAAILPWVNFLGMKLTSLPDRKQRELKNNIQHLDVIDKLEYETKLQEIKARKQMAIVESAKADEEAKLLKDPDVRQQVRAEFEETEEHFSDGRVPDSILEENFAGWPLEELESEIESLDVNLENLVEAQKEKIEELETLDAEEIKNQGEYAEGVSNFTINEEFLKLQKLKISRAKEVQKFQSNLVEVEDFLGLLGHQINMFKSRKNRLMSALEEKYGL